MLAKISAVEGSILDDDRVVDGMEVLMKEGSQVEEQISKSAEVMTQVQVAVGRFEPLSITCRDLFVVLEAMREISFLYEFSAGTFMDVLDHVLATQSSRSAEVTDETIASLKTALFTEIAARVGRGLQVDDKVVFTILLARLYKGDQSIGAEEVSSTAEYVSIIEGVFGKDFPWQGRSLSALKAITANEISSTVPLMLCSAPGHDVSSRVESMARELGNNLNGVAMGSEEGFNDAEKFVTSASKRGGWVMLKNCHLCTDWLRETLVKKLQSLGAGTHKDFRIFITSEINSKLPTGLLRISDVIVAEAPTGVKASISRFLTSIAIERFGNPVKNRLYLILAWVHSVVQERLRYLPRGWTEKYEFTEADANHGLDVIDSLMDEAFGARQQLDPDKIPWDAIRSTLQKGVFGGRITNDVDQAVLDKLVTSVFTPHCFDVGFKLADSDDAPVLPEGSSPEEIFGWIDDLQSNTPPTWIGLDAEAEIARQQRIAQSVSKRIKIVSELLDFL